MSAVFSLGSWFRFQNIITAIAARNNKIPIIELQNGGKPFFQTSPHFDDPLPLVNRKILKSEISITKSIHFKKIKKK